MAQQASILVRIGLPDDLPFLSEMLFEAFHWQSQENRPPLRSFQNDLAFQILLADWGRDGDTAVVAELGGESVGAAWYRLWTDDVHSYGYVDSQTPELGMAVSFKHRSQGVGRMLLRSLMNIARANHVKAMSLSVDPNNIARRLYESEGFVKVGESGTSWTLACRLCSWQMVADRIGTSS